MNNQIEKLKNQISKIQQKHSNDLGKLKHKLSELEQKTLTGLIKDPEYRGNCFFVFSDGVVQQHTLTASYVFALRQGRTFYDKESAKRFREHERLQYELSCATESATGLYFLRWNLREDWLDVHYYISIHVRFGFKSRADADKFASNYTPDQIKLMLGVGL
jgi:hypothetical protein